MPPAVHEMNPSLRPAALSAHRHRLSTDGIADGDRLAYWLDMICALYARLECDHPEAEVHGEIEFSNLGALQLTEVQSNVQCVRRTPSMIRTDTRDACRVKAYVVEHLRDPELTIGGIAAAMRMSPDHLSRLFRSEPVPLSRWIWQQRLDACRRDLCDPRLIQRGISDIAFSWGFNDATHFSRSFRELFGVSPREWRQQGDMHTPGS